MAGAQLISIALYYGTAFDPALGLKCDRDTRQALMDRSIAGPVLRTYAPGLRGSTWSRFRFGAFSVAPVVRRSIKKLPFLYRIGFRLSESETVDGLWVGALAVPATLQRVIDALSLIRRYDRQRYDRLIRDLDRVWVHLLGGTGSFDADLALCELDYRFVENEATSIEAIASVIVHEATHARIEWCGIPYKEPFRQRIERVCLRREVAFSLKLPNGDDIREQAEACLQQPEFDLTYETYQNDQIELMRSAGVPHWLIRLVLALRSIRLWVRGLIRRGRREQGAA